MNKIFLSLLAIGTALLVSTQSHGTDSEQKITSAVIVENSDRIHLYDDLERPSSHCASGTAQIFCATKVGTIKSELSVGGQVDRWAPEPQGSHHLANDATHATQKKVCEKIDPATKEFTSIPLYGVCIPKQAQVK